MRAGWLFRTSSASMHCTFNGRRSRFSSASISTVPQCQSSIGSLQPSRRSILMQTHALVNCATPLAQMTIPRTLKFFGHSGMLRMNRSDA